VLVSTDWLRERLNDPTLVLVDVRWRERGSGRASYEQGHIPGAVFLDWMTDIVDLGHPVAFMLAPPERFARVMERCGIGDDTTVVAYGDELGSGPHRLWWASCVYGHDNIRVLDGGLDKWRTEGRPLSREIESPRPATWTPRSGGDLVAAAADVVAACGDPAAVVLDSRRPEQFRGEAVWFETGQVPANLDGIAHTPRGTLVAGRVPWAVNVPAQELYRPDSTMKSPDELRTLFRAAGVRPESRTITYCGVGISAAALLFALSVAGVEQSALYDGSWDEWGRDPSLPVARG
jgi:thiosulfate/3-mercaptopyruvate sulfurtransferase